MGTVLFVFLVCIFMLSLAFHLFSYMYLYILRSRLQRDLDPNEFTSRTFTSNNTFGPTVYPFSYLMRNFLIYQRIPKHPIHIICHLGHDFGKVGANFFMALKDMRLWVLMMRTQVFMVTFLISFLNLIGRKTCGQKDNKTQRDCRRHGRVREGRRRSSLTHTPHSSLAGYLSIAYLNFLSLWFLVEYLK